MKRTFFIDWCVNCATTFAGKNIKKQMFADIFTRIAKSVQEQDKYFYRLDFEVFHIDETFFNLYIKNTICIEKFWFKKPYWKFLVGMIRKDYEKPLPKKCKISFDSDKFLSKKDGSVTFKFYK